MWRKGLCVLVGAVLLGGIAGCQPAEQGVIPEDRYPPEERAWRQAMREGSPQALRAFAEQYPDSSYAPEARAQVEALEWYGAMTSGSLEKHVLYLAHHPSGAHAEKARQYVRMRLLQEGAEWLPRGSGLEPSGPAAGQPYSETLRTGDLGSGRRWQYKLTFIYFDGAWYRLISEGK